MDLIFLIWPIVEVFFFRYLEEFKTSRIFFETFLPLKPVKRVMDYPLLVEKILKNTDPSHPDYYFLQKALKMSKNLCEQVNEGTRHKENTERLEWLQIHVDSAKNPGLCSIFNIIYPLIIVNFTVW